MKLDLRVEIFFLFLFIMPGIPQKRSQFSHSPRFALWNDNKKNFLNRLKLRPLLLASFISFPSSSTWSKRKTICINGEFFLSLHHASIDESPLNFFISRHSALTRSPDCLIGVKCIIKLYRFILQDNSHAVVFLLTHFNKCTNVARIKTTNRKYVSGSLSLPVNILSWVTWCKKNRQ